MPNLNELEKLEGVIGRVLGQSHFTVKNDNNNEILCRIDPESNQRQVKGLIPGRYITARVANKTDRGIYLLLNIRVKKVGK